MKFFRYIKYIKYIPGTLYFNLKLKCHLLWIRPYFPFVVTSRFKVYSDSSAKVFFEPGSYLRLGYGSGGVAAFDHTGINVELYESSIIKLNGASLIGYGSSICIYSNASLEIGDDTYMAGNAVIKCAKRIKIGSSCAISWNVTIIDSDFHPWSINGLSKEISKPVIIEDHVWIGNNVIVLKGVTIGSGSIVGAGSVVTRNVPKNCLVVGNPAKIVKCDVSW